MLHSRFVIHHHFFPYNLFISKPINSKIRGIIPKNIIEHNTCILPIVKGNIPQPHMANMSIEMSDGIIFPKPFLNN